MSENYDHLPHYVKVYFHLIANNDLKNHHVLESRFLGDHFDKGEKCLIITKWLYKMVRKHYLKNYKGVKINYHLKIDPCVPMPQLESIASTIDSLLFYSVMESSLRVDTKVEYRHMPEF